MAQSDMITGEHRTPFWERKFLSIPYWLIGLIILLIVFYFLIKNYVCEQGHTAATTYRLSPELARAPAYSEVNPLGPFR